MIKISKKSNITGAYSTQKGYKNLHSDTILNNRSGTYTVLEIRVTVSYSESDPLMFFSDSDSIRKYILTENEPFPRGELYSILAL
jgi:hypothetical protein